MLANAVYQIKRPYHLVKTGLGEGLPAQISHRFPERKLKIIAITGTDGKTTSSTLLYHVLKAAGKKVGLISTIAAYIGDQPIDTGFHVTAPRPKQLYAFMRQMVEAGCEYLVLETTSHGIYQYRTWGIKPLIAGLTNIAPEHLDYHVNYDNYVAAKAELLTAAKTAVINGEDQSAAKVRRILRDHSTQTVEYTPQDKLPRNIQQATTERFSESFNQTNVRFVTAIAHLLNIENTAIAEAITNFPLIPGRMDYLKNKRKLTIVVDFVHTPQGLEAALTDLNKTRKAGKKLIAVFGCASQRDRSKRPVMTEIAVRLADLVVITAEDPRHEDIWSIFREMKEQLTTGHNKIVSIADRGQAIAFALDQAKPGDIIGVFGKGHEQSMAYGDREYAWSDQQAIEELLAGKEISNKLLISPSDK